MTADQKLINHAIQCTLEECGWCDEVSQRDLAEAALELYNFINDITPSECDKRELNGGRRYWCSTHNEYGTGHGCAGEMGRALVEKYKVT